MALHSILGGSPSGFHIACAKPCHFWFSVASHEVGFLITSLKRITTNFFDVYFHLWRDGGANWKLEFRKWEEEEEASWTKVSRRKKVNPDKHVRFASPIKQCSPKRKSLPELNSSFVRIGDVDCSVKDSSNRLKSSISSTPAPIPVKKVFGSLHGQLHEVRSSSLLSNSNLNLNSSSSSCVLSPEGFSFGGYSPIAVLPLEYALGEDLSAKKSARKRKPTPVTKSSLRRSKRIKAANEGFRPASPGPIAKRVIGKKVTTPQSAKSGKTSLFPDLALINQIINNAMVHPHIPIDNLQKVAMETCGITPMEVTRELLLAEQGPNQGQDGSSRSGSMQIVPYGFYNH
jgi:hypothetical protein